MPAVAPPSDGTHYLLEEESGFVSRFERRIARLVDPGELPPATSCYWVRLGDIPSGSTLALTIVADLVPMALSDTIGRPMFGSSLDNTMRFVTRSTDEWVLAEMQVETVSDGVGHVGTRLWSPSGALLATGSQTCAVSPR